MIQTEREAVQYIEEGVAHVSDTLLNSLLPTRLLGAPFPSRTLLSPPDLRPLTCEGLLSLGAVVFGHVVGHPVHFGGPALSQSLVELLPELLQRIVVCFPQSQRVL